MEAFLRGYEVNPPTWFYLSFLLILAVYFRFTRVFSLRNVDLALLLAASPGLLFVNFGVGASRMVGHVWLIVTAGLFLLRLFLDSVFSRRPYLGQNMNVPGLAFLCCSAFAFLMTQAITKPTLETTQSLSRQAGELLNRTPTTVRDGDEELSGIGPAPAVLATPLKLMFEDTTIASRIFAIFAHSAVLVGLWFVGRNLFADKSLGLSMATLYLLLPCTAFNVGQYVHVLPAALIVWAFVCYRRPAVSGVLLGLACGTMLFPIFLVPIWTAFYGWKRAPRFLTALGAVVVVLFSSYALTSPNLMVFVQKIFVPIDGALSQVSGSEIANAANSGDYFWGNLGILSVYRWPVMVAYFVMLTILTLWPRSRSMEVLLAQSAAAIVGTQFWYPQQGGVYLLWYLPLILIVVFRPRLTHLRPLEPAAVAEEQNRAGTANAGSASYPPRPATARSVQLFR